jgi:hypothetical protein
LKTLRLKEEKWVEPKDRIYTRENRMIVAVEKKDVVRETQPRVKWRKGSKNSLVKLQAIRILARDASQVRAEGGLVPL